MCSTAQRSTAQRSTAQLKELNLNVELIFYIRRLLLLLLFLPLPIQLFTITSPGPPMEEDGGGWRMLK